MNPRTQNNDWATVAAIALAAMCVVTTVHEALGHGGACLALGGRIALLTSSLFHCGLGSPWISPAGPIANLLGGTLLLLALSLVPRRLAALRLFLVLVTSFSFFWEGAYAIKAMLARNGDLYFAGQDFLGEPSLWWRIAGAVAGLCLYLFTARWASLRLGGFAPDTAAASRLARTAWIAATLGTALAALAYPGEGWDGMKDAVLEIGAASLPLLFMPFRNQAPMETSNFLSIGRGGKTISFSLAVFAVFVLTLGHGLRF